MLGLRTTIYKVSDLEKAKAWYSKAFSVEPYFVEPFYIGFNIKAMNLDCCQKKIQLQKVIM